VKATLRKRGRRGNKPKDKPAHVRESTGSVLIRVGPKKRRGTGNMGAIKRNRVGMKEKIKSRGGNLNMKTNKKAASATKCYYRGKHVGVGNRDGHMRFGGRNKGGEGQKEQPKSEGQGTVGYETRSRQEG